MTRFARAQGSKSSNERIPEKSTPWHVMKDEMHRVQQETEDNKNREKHEKIRQQNYDNFLKQQVTEEKTEWADFTDDETSNTKQKKISKSIEKKKKNQDKKLTISKQEMQEMLKPDIKIDAQLAKLTSQIDVILDKEKLKRKKTSKKELDNNDIENINNKNIEEEMNGTTETEKPKKKKSLKNINKSANNLSKENHPVGKNNNEKKKNKFKKQCSEVEENKIIEDVDNPIEVSAKIEPPKIIVPKQKKKKVQKIKSVQIEIESKDDQSTGKTEIINNTDKKIDNVDKALPENMTKSMKKRYMRKLKRLSENKETNADSDKTEPKIIPNNNQNPRKRKLPTEKYVKPEKTPHNQPKMKAAKVRDNNEHKRRKPDEGPIKMTFNGIEIEVVKFEGFPVKKEDADRLTELRKQMISKGIPRSQVKRALQLERRKAEKSLAREKKKVCFQCRKSGHMLSECPELNSQQISFSGTGICYKCGSAEHTHFECKVTKGEVFKFASCFICREQGHIAKQCPDNPKGLYPQGGACRLCGDVTHLKKDCPQTMQEKEDNTVTLNTISGGNLETLDEELNKSVFKPTPVKNKIVKF